MNDQRSRGDGKRLINSIFFDNTFQPLAARIAAGKLAQYIGQRHLLAADASLRLARY